MTNKKLVVIGGGAAGFFCAINAARLNPSLEVILLERTGKVLQKVRVSGGGRCNATHACFDIGEMAERYPRGAKFVRKAFHHFFTTDTIEWFKARGVPFKTEPDGRMFPEANTSQAIMDCLLKDANQHKVQLMMNREVRVVLPVTNGFEVHLKDEGILPANFVMLACGGFQRIEQFDWLQNLALKIVPPVPSLFTFNFPNHPLNKLMGVSVPMASVKIIGTKLTASGPMLVTHWGLSGPAVLRLSAFAARALEVVRYQFKISINWHPQMNENTCLQQLQVMRSTNASQRVVKSNFTQVPARLWEFLLTEAGIGDDKRWADISAASQNKLAKLICNYEVQANGKTIFKEEFVTAGGIDLSEIDANTMMVKKYPNLFVGGEIMDVDGITGGYNFQHAWTSGFIAAKAIAG